MRLGAMNHPARDPLRELDWIAEAGFEFVDLTVEPPAAQEGRLQPGRLRARARELGLEVVGHTFWGLPIGSAVERLRRAAVEQLAADLELLAEAGARGATIHPDSRVPHLHVSEVVGNNRQSLAELGERARALGVSLWVENVPGPFNLPRHLRPLLDQLPQAALTLDVGHANLMPNGSVLDPLLKAFGQRLAHVHLSDNRGGAQDLHLPLGSGLIEWPEVLASLKASGYDGTITVEVFSEDLDYRVLSREKAMRWWSGE